MPNLEIYNLIKKHAELVGLNENIDNWNLYFNTPISRVFNNFIIYLESTSFAC